MFIKEKIISKEPCVDSMHYSNKLVFGWCRCEGDSMPRANCCERVAVEKDDSGRYYCQEHLEKIYG